MKCDLARGAQKFFRFGLIPAILCAAVFCGSGAADEIAPGQDVIKVLYFYTDSCRPCKWMTPVVDKLKQYYSGSVDIVKIDALMDTVLARKYGVKAVPTMIFLDRSHQEVLRKKGFMSEKQIKNQLIKMGARG